MILADVSSIARLYPKTSALRAGVQGDAGPDIGAGLIADWLRRYRPRHTETVSLKTHGFHYLFDITCERLIGAWGASRGAVRSARDQGRMRGHPLSAGPGYHRGHAVAHSLGGGLDINLVPQLGCVNVGAFRALERLAASKSGALYFTHWLYRTPRQRTPARVEQGLLAPGQRLLLAVHDN